MYTVTSKDAWWTMFRKNGDGTDPNRPSMKLIMRFKEDKPVSRTWIIKDQFTGEEIENWTIEFATEKNPNRVARDMTLAWQLYSSNHTDKDSVDKLLLNTPFSLPFKVSRANVDYTTYEDVWRSISRYGPYPVGGKFVFKNEMKFIY
jgi:hypothetical protein